MWYSSRDDVDRGWVPPSRNDRGWVPPSRNTSTYRHRAVGYGQSPYSNNVHGVQHCFITPGQRRHVKSKTDFTLLTSVLVLVCTPRPQGHGVLFRFLVGPLFRAPQIFKVFSKKFDALTSLFSYFEFQTYNNQTLSS